MIDQKTAWQRYLECGGYEEEDLLERLRFYCSLAMNGQDWVDSEKFFQDIQAHYRVDGCGV